MGVIEQIQVDQVWLALAVGNSRLHWAWFVGDTLKGSWEIEQVPVTAIAATIAQWTPDYLPESLFPPGSVREELKQVCHHQSSYQLPLYVASVVPAQTALWRSYPYMQAIALDQLPLQGLYSTLGIDRVLTVLGAGRIYGYPVLVIDAGTALTFTGADLQRQFVGGAILPGLRLQLQALAEHTAALPMVETPTGSDLPARWAKNTPEAIASGILYALLAGIRDFIQSWRQQFPDSTIAFTGGDGMTLLSYLQGQDPELVQRVYVHPHLLFEGMNVVVNQEG